MTEQEQVPGADAFSASRTRVDELVDWLEGAEAAALSHADLEQDLSGKGRELLRQFYQDHLDLRAIRELRRTGVVDAAGLPRNTLDTDHSRTLTTVFGTVRVRRFAYRKRGKPNLHPADAQLNLPEEQYSYGVRQVAAQEAAQKSFAAAAETIKARTGEGIGLRQVEALVHHAAEDFDAFYQEQERPPVADGAVVVCSTDAKGIVMRPKALRPATAAAASRAAPPLETRLSPGEKANRKRMAQVGAVYTVAPCPRTPKDILGPHGAERSPAPQAQQKWLTASVVENTRTVITSIFQEAERRDPGHSHRRLWLVDGNNDQIAGIQEEARERKLSATILIDFIHVLEYVWSAAWCFFPHDDPAAEAWVRDRGLAILNGKAETTAAAIRGKATALHLRPEERANADRCADYLRNKLPYLDYPTALSEGWPIATGVIEGACRHLVKDRMDITGARWCLTTAEAVLKLRALRSNGEFERYWNFHVQQQYRRVHLRRYAPGVLTAA